MTGPNDEWMRGRVDEVLARATRPDRVEVLGFVDDLVDLYRGASALVFTSRAEGFGLPIVEAMACGTPVVAFDNTSIPEVAGDAGVLVPDGEDRKSTRLNSSHANISYAVFFLKKKKI